MVRSRAAAAIVTLVLVGAAPRAARAQVQKSGPEVWPGKNELSLHLGFQTGLNTYGRGGGPPGGAKILADYNFRFQDAGVYSLWLNIGLNFVAGVGCASVNGVANAVCNGAYANGDTVEPAAGIVLKFRTPVPVVPYAKLDATIVGVFLRYCGDNGAAFAGRVGGGVNYFVTKWLGLGIDFGFTLGPAYYGGAPASCTGIAYSSHVEFYAAFDLSAGASFAF
jgi:hypothetical protein